LLGEEEEDEVCNNGIKSSLCTDNDDDAFADEDTVKKDIAEI
jgi:hypothetical protein